MKLKKIFICFICSITIFCSATYAIDNNKKNNLLSEDLTPPRIENFIPSKCQQFIVGRPAIEIYYSDDSNIDLESVRLYLNYEDVTDKSIISDKKILYYPTKKLKRGSHIVKIKLRDLSKNKNEQAFEWYFTVGTPVYNQYRGLLHAHTDASDGHGSFDDALYLAKYKAKLDFFAITEHSNLLDNHKNCTLNDAKISSKWCLVNKSIDKFNKKNNFLAINGFELTYNHKCSNPVGHLNIFNSDGFITERDLPLDDFYKILSENKNLIVQFNHPCNKFGDFNKLKYDKQADDVISLFEIGNGYSPDMSKNINSFDNYQLALDNGWHVSPTNGQDNHRVDFGIANEFRTVVLSTDLTKDAIFNSLKNMRTYATQDKNIKIDYTINDAPMGSTLADKSKLNFAISAIDNDINDKIKEIQVISNNGEIIKSKEFNSNLTKLEFCINYEKNKFYYVKIIQNNNKISITAPIWTKK